MAMKYKLVNLSTGNLQVNLYSPKKINHNCETLNRPGPVVALNLKRGTAVDILQYFDGSVEKAHESVCYSRDVLRLFGPATLGLFVCDDDDKEIDPKAIIGTVSIEEEVKDTIVPEVKEEQKEIVEDSPIEGKPEENEVEIQEEKTSAKTTKKIRKKTSK
jgi:hypothetical protein